MNEPCDSCRYERVYALQYENVRDDLNELKERVGRLETTLMRGVFLLVANLVGVVITLAQQLLRS
ncbi:MAG TPA: hypothetical protein HPP77_07025 [Candidatus Hydrogenedentes bacterium]|nr:hypothetical protein [Candidatus Hydrogenedentota bacterium]HIJ74650.1 hypothetical protein [Candidatus Hydrogenedentota bacterium]